MSMVMHCTFILEFFVRRQLSLFLATMLFTITACGGGYSGTTENTDTADTTPPVIALNGDNPMSVTLGEQL